MLVSCVALSGVWRLAWKYLVDSGAWGGGGLPHIRGLVIYSFCSNHNVPENPTRIKEVSI